MRRKAFIALFLLPACAIYGLFVIYPLVQAIAFSGYRWRGVSSRRTFVGAENYLRLAHDEVFWKAVRNSVTLLFVAGFAILVLAVLIAHGISGTGRISKTLRSVLLFPQMTSTVVVAVLWMFIFNPQFGLLMRPMHALGVESWLGDPKTALPSVGLAFVWYGVGFYVMLFAAGLRAIPLEVGEAATLDGASGWERFWRVTWPMLWSIKRIAIVHLTITVVNIFALVFLMTGGGPDRATETILTYLYEAAFKNSEFGYATTIAVANFGLVMLLSLGILFLFRRNPEAARS